MNKNTKIFICCTEQSGDNIAYNILKRIKLDNIQVDGVCGSKAEKFYHNKYYDIRDFKAMGIFEVIFSLKNYINKINFLANKIMTNKYDLIITIDSPDFNYQLVKKIRKYKFSKNIVHIVAPTVWAWRPQRAKKFSIIYDEILTLFKFEESFFNKHGLKTSFIGHPIFHIKPQTKNNTKNFISFLPGSREKEINTLLPYYEIAYKFLIETNSNYKIFIPTLPHLKNIIINKTKHWKIKTIILTDIDEIEKYFDKVYISITCSGTAAIEIAKRNIPQLVIYKFNFFTIIMIKLFVKVKFANLFNIFANKMIIPELVNFNLTKKNFIKEFKSLINDKERNNLQILDINKNIFNFESDVSPYDISVKKIMKFL